MIFAHQHTPALEAPLKGSEEGAQAHTQNRRPLLSAYLTEDDRERLTGMSQDFFRAILDGRWQAIEAVRKENIAANPELAHLAERIALAHMSDHECQQLGWEVER